MFTPEQRTELGKPLNRAHVKTRTQAGRQLSYVEGWHAIAEANRVFGFDGWMRETIEIKCVSEKDREIGQRKEPGFGVSYVAKVRVTVGGVIREGIGAGHGIDRDLGQAHESAIKEAETDAMKRAMMTFGNIFGLALYDKDQEHVTDDRPQAPQEKPAERSSVDGLLKEPAASEVMAVLIDEINGCVTADELNKFVASDNAQRRYRVLPQKHKDKVLAAKDTRYGKIKDRAA